MKFLENGEKMQLAWLNTHGCQYVLAMVVDNLCIMSVIISHSKALTPYGPILYCRGDGTYVNINYGCYLTLIIVLG